MTDRLTLPSRSHSRIPPRHGARLAPSPSHPFRSRIPGRAPRPGPRRSGGVWGRRPPGPGTRWKAPRGRPGQDGGGPNGSVWGQGRGRHGCGGGAGVGREGGVSVGVPGTGGSLTWGRRRLGAPGVGSGAGTVRLADKRNALRPREAAGLRSRHRLGEGPGKKVVGGLGAGPGRAGLGAGPSGTRGPGGARLPARHRPLPGPMPGATRPHP